MPFAYRKVAKTIIARVYEVAEGGELRALVELCGEDEIAFLLDEEHAERRLATLQTNLERILSDYEERRMVPPLMQSESSASFFVFRYTDDPSLPEQDRELLARYRLHASLVRLLRMLSPALFESLCGRVLHLIGCARYFVTRESKDEGVDCFGRLAAAPEPTPGGLALEPLTRVLGSLSFLLFAQAKRYDEGNTVDVVVVREIEGTWRNIANAHADRTLRDDLERGLSAVGYRAADPVLLMVMTTSTFTGPARKSAETMGVITLDGDQLAQLLLAAEFACERKGEAEWETNSEILERFCGDAA